jgi:TonB-linked SusC/RagA family outer membrane protein
MKKFLPVFIWLAMISVTPLSAQFKTVRGTVFASEKGTPLAGVSVSVKGTSLGTVTNQQGLYVLDIPEDVNSLIFSFIGKKTKEVLIDGLNVDVTLEPDIVGLNEVVVVAYGSAQKNQFTGSVSSISAAQLERFHAADFSRTLNGLSSGVMTAGGSGQPGEGDDIRIRGFNTFGDASPLIVLDGFPYSGKLNAIPVSDIETVTILKDATATALYGSRAANGVIIVTSKKGTSGSAGIDVRMSYGMTERAMPDYEKVSAGQYYELQWESIRNFLINPQTTREVAGTQASSLLVTRLGSYNAFDVPAAELVGSDGKLHPGAHPLWTDNWYDELLGRGSRREISLNAGGSTDRTAYFLSGSVLNEDGIIKASNLKRYTIRANLNSKLTNSITAGVNLMGSLTEQNYPDPENASLLNPFRFINLIAPIYPVYLYNQNGVVQNGADGNRLFDFGSGFGRSRPVFPSLNVLGTIELDERLYKNDVFTLRSFLDFTLAKDLIFTTSLSADHYTFTGLTHKNMSFGDGVAHGGRSTRDVNRTFSYTANQMIRYDRNIGEHGIQALAAHENYNYKYNVLTATRSGFPFPGLVELGGAAVGEGSGSYEDNYRLESYFGKVDYSFRNRYFVSLNFRRDGNSRFAKDVRWGSFWGAGAGWLLSEEEFIEVPDWISLLKIKASYGQQGNDKIGSYYGYQELYQAGMNNINYPGLIASRLATPGLTWESLNSFNAGLELILNERFAFSFDYYIRDNNNLLFQQPLPPSTGFTSIDANAARLSNKGADLEVKALLVNSNNFQWTSELYLSHFKNQIKELPQGSIISGNKRWEVGRSVYDFWIEEFAGVNQETGRSQFYMNVPLRDANNNPVLDSSGNPVYEEERGITETYSQAGRYYQGSAIPDLTGGFNNTFSFYGFDLSVLINYGLGGKVFDFQYQLLMHSGQYGTNFHVDILNRWTPENKNTNVPVLNASQTAAVRSSRFLADADHLILRNVSLGYQLPRGLVSRYNLGDIYLNMKADNLLMLTARKGLIPVQSFDGNRQLQHVPVQTVSVGMDIHF